MGFETEGSYDTGSFRVVKKFVEAGCFFDLYLHPTDVKVRGTKQFSERFADYIELARNTGRVQILPSMPANQVIPKLKSYDYGFGMRNAANFFDVPWQTHNPEGRAYILSARHFDYVDANLKILVDGNQNLNLRFFRESGCVVNGTETLKSGCIFKTLKDHKKKQNGINPSKKYSIKTS